MHAAGTIGTRAGAGVVAQAPLLAPAHDARGGVQAEGAAAGQEQRRDGVRPRPAAPSSSVSRVAGPPPRTSTAPTVPGGGRITVQPVPAAASVQWPTRTPGTALTTGAAPAGSGGTSRCRAGRRGSCRMVVPQRGQGSPRVQVDAQQVLHRAPSRRASRGSCRWRRRRPPRPPPRRSRIARCRRRISSASREPAGRSGWMRAWNRASSTYMFPRPATSAWFSSTALIGPRRPVQQVPEHPGGEPRRQGLDADPLRSSRPRDRPPGPAGRSTPARSGACRRR